MVDVSLALYYLAWFIGNYYYTLWNKLASVEAGGKAGGLLVTISVMQLAVCSVYAILLWVVGYNPVGLVGLQKPTKQSVPKITLADVGSMLVLVCCYAGAHSAGVVALTAGSPQFGQIVKAAEPVFSAVVNTIIYANSPSLAKWCCLPLIVGGVAISTLKTSAAGGYSIEFDTTALMAGSVNNMFAAFKGSENKKVMERAGLKERLGGTGNQFGVTNVLALLVSLPVMVALEVHAPTPRALESAPSRPPARPPARPSPRADSSPPRRTHSQGAQWPKFVSLVQENAAFRNYLIASGAVFYLCGPLLLPLSCHAAHLSCCCAVHVAHLSCCRAVHVAHPSCCRAVHVSQVQRARDAHDQEDGGGDGVGGEHGKARIRHRRRLARTRQGAALRGEARRDARHRRCDALLIGRPYLVREEESEEGVSARELLPAHLNGVCQHDDFARMLPAPPDELPVVTESRGVAGCMHEHATTSV